MHEIYEGLAAIGARECWKPTSVGQTLPASDAPGVKRRRICVNEYRVAVH